MLHITFSDVDMHLRFAPLSLTRPVSKLKMGLMSFEDRWLEILDQDAVIAYETVDYLQVKYGQGGVADIYLNPTVIPNKSMANEILNLPMGFELKGEHGWIARHGKSTNQVKEFTGHYTQINHTWELFLKNEGVLDLDFNLLTEGRSSQRLNGTNTLIGERIFIEEGAEVNGAILNAQTGPIYVGKNAEIQEGAMIRGGLGLLQGATIRMGAKIYGPTLIGKYSKVGGEVTNSIIQGYSNKGHEGYLGNSVLGEWCNLGADTNTSNLKNNYSKVRAFSYETNQMEDTGCQFVGLTMGDHSKCGINTMFNTGTVVGVAANIFGGDFPPKYIPSFAWGGAAGFTKYELAKAIETAQRVKARRGLELSKEEVSILTHIENNTEL